MLRLKIVYKDERYEIVDHPVTSCLEDLKDRYNAEFVEILYYQP